MTLQRILLGRARVRGCRRHGPAKASDRASAAELVADGPGGPTVDQVEATRLVLAEREALVSSGSYHRGRSAALDARCCSIRRRRRAPARSRGVELRRGRARAGPLPTSRACGAVVARRGGRAVRPRPAQQSPPFAGVDPFPPPMPGWGRQDGPLNDDTGCGRASGPEDLARRARPRGCARRSGRARPRRTGCCPRPGHASLAEGVEADPSDRPSCESSRFKDPPELRTSSSTATPPASLNPREVKRRIRDGCGSSS